MNSASINQSPGAMNARNTRASGASPLPHILVVEDNEDILQFYAGVLTDAGYGVETASDGDSGWKALQAASYDLLITDNAMPKLSGVELIEAMRAARLALPVILMTGAAPANPARLDLAALLEKPCPPDQFLQTVNEVLHASTAGAYGESVARLDGFCAGDSFASGSHSNTKHRSNIKQRNEIEL